MADEAQFDGLLREQGFVKDVTTVARATFEKRPVYKLRVVYASGNEQQEYFDSETGLLLGCVDGRSSPIEDVDLTVALAAKILEATRPPLLLLSSSCDLDLLPRSLADRKVHVLGAATRQLREAIPC